MWFGLTEGRQLGDEALLLEASAIHGMLRSRSSGTMYIDFTAALPSVFHRWIWQVMHDMSVPAPLTIALSACTLAPWRTPGLDALSRCEFASPLGPSKVARPQSRCLLVRCIH